MSNVISVPLAPPVSVTNVSGSGKDARAAAAPLLFRTTLSNITVDCSQLGPTKGFSSIATIFIDNSLNTAPVMVTFLDTGVTAQAPAGASIYILAITGLLQVQFTSIVAADTAVNVALLNFLAGPTGVQPISGTVTAVIGPITVTNPGPASGAVLDDSLAIVAATPTQVLAANPNRKYFMAQFPAGVAGVGSSDGWYSFTNVAVGPNLAGCFYAGAGEKIWSETFCPTNPLYVYLNNAGEMPVVVG